LVAALPILALFVLIGGFRVRIQTAAFVSLATAFLVAIFINGMPLVSAVASGIYGAAYGFFPIGWVLLNVVFLYQLTAKKGHLDVLRQSLMSVAPDARIQIILVAFAFGSFLEGMSGFGAPMAITSALLLQFGFQPLTAASLSLLGITASVAFGSLGLPITALEQVTGLDGLKVSAIVGRQLPFFSLIMPFWLVAFFGGFRALRGIWPLALAAGLGLAVPQFLMSNFHGPWLVDIVSGVVCLLVVVGFVRLWKPQTHWDVGGMETAEGPALSESAAEGNRGRDVFMAWLPWLILTILVFIWGLPQTVKFLDGIFMPKLAIPYLDGVVLRVPPIVPAGAKAEAALFKLNLLSASGTGILLAAVISGFCMGCSLKEMGKVYCQVIQRLKSSLLLISAMLALGHIMKYSGCDATLGLALALTGGCYPFFGTLLGWMGVAMTGSDTSTNVLFGNLQKITAQQIGMDPALMCAGGTTGGVMGKAIAAQSLVVVASATNTTGKEGDILRKIFLHSLLLACLMGLLVCLQAYVPPFTRMVENIR